MDYVPEKYHHQSLTGKAGLPAIVVVPDENSNQLAVSPNVIRSLETRYLCDIKHQVERILGWEPAKYWQPKDFAQLSNRIYAYTQYYVSAQELQKLWHGPSAGLPRPLLLDTLARFTDFRDWEDFRTRQFYGIIETHQETVTLHHRTWQVPTRWALILWYISAVLSVITAGLLIWFR